MATIAEIRQQYPQYDDLSDTALADSFHSKFYSDIPKDTFYAQLGIKQNTKPIDAPITSGFLMGLKDPISGGAQFLPKALETVTSLGGMAPNPVSKFFGSEAERVGGIVKGEEEAYQTSRKTEGETGFDFSRLAGNVFNPANLAAVTRGPALVRAASTGAIAGASQPVYGKDEDYWSSKALQAGLGAALGPLTELGVNGIGKLAGAVKSLTPAGREQALKKYVDGLAGSDKQAVIKALQEAKELVSGSRPTVAEALSDIPSAAELIAAQSKLASKQKVAGKFADRAAEQQAARVRALQGIAGTEAERAAVVAERDAVTGTMRETALDQANVAAPIFTRLEKEIADKFNGIAAAEQTAGMTGLASSRQQATAVAGKPGWLSAGDIASEAAQKSQAYKGLAGNLRQEAQLKQFQLKSLEQNGFFPLRSSDITDRLDGAIRGTSSDQSKLVLQALKDKIISKADENGMLNSRDLYENVRKTSNQEINKLLGLGEQYASGGIPDQAAKALSNAKKFIDASLDKSTDGLWSKYLTSYADYSNKLNRMEVGDFLVQRLQTNLDKERAGVFATAVENAAGTIKKSTGIPRYDKLDQVLTPKEVGTVNAVLADLSRKNKAEQLAAKVGQLESGLPDVAGSIPGFLSSTVTVAKEALNYLQRGNQQQFNAKMADLMLEPAAFAQLMTSGVDKGRVSSLVSSMFKYMDEPTKAAFVQSFTVPVAAREGGQ
jgi:hypothetical protein